MRDDSGKWPMALGTDRPPFETSGVRLSIVRPDRQTMLSGPITTCLKQAGLCEAMGWPEVSETKGSYALRLRRDRLLVVNGAPMTQGWYNGVATSDVSDGYGVVEVDGRDAFAVLQRGTEISRAVPSGSVARQFSGFGVFLYACGASRFRLHVARGHLDALCAMLEVFAAQAESEHREQNGI